MEGGPRLLGNFLAERLLDELFLTLAHRLQVVMSKASDQAW